MMETPECSREQYRRRSGCASRPAVSQGSGNQSAEEKAYVVYRDSAKASPSTRRGCPRGKERREGGREGEEVP
ncbi:hypothetical protein SLE2022_085480 [Rubroshorea leprosula]